MDKCPSGAVTINDTLMHSAVPNLVRTLSPFLLQVPNYSPLVESEARDSAFTAANMDSSASPISVP